MKRSLIPVVMATALMMLFVLSCTDNEKKEPAPAAELYTCPMPSDSVFSDHPGKCPKCGMELVKVENSDKMGGMGMEGMDMSGMEHGTGIAEMRTGYTCPMHPQVFSDTMGTCSICGMQLEKIKSPAEPDAVSLKTLLGPVNQQVVASIPMVHMMEREENIEMESYGFINYDTRQVGVVSSNVGGRIEKLYVKYRYQKVYKGQKIMDIYSPELLTAQENLLFLIKNDPDNSTMIGAATQKLLLLGMSQQQLNHVQETGKVSYTVSVYSGFSGHIHESGGDAMEGIQADEMNKADLTTMELSIKEGMYVKKGQNIFSVFNPDRAWTVLNIFAGQAAMVKTGDKVRIIPETNPDMDFRATISYIEPYYREGSKTLTARVYFDNSKLKIPIGSQVKAIVFAGKRSAFWLPEEAVLALGLNKVVFVRSGESFTARKISTGIINKHLIQVLDGLEKTEAVAANAQYLVDSESFIKTN